VSAAIEEWEADFGYAYKDVRAIAVSVGDETVLERYFDDSQGEYAGVADVTKSVMSLLVGIAIDQGHIPEVEATVGQLLPGHGNEMAPGIADVTLAQLLTMTAGMRPDNPDGTTFYDPTNNWVRAILTEGLERSPGEAFAYASASSHLLSAILVEATGQQVLDYARDHLFYPLGIDTTPASEIQYLAGTAEDFAATRQAYRQADFVWPRDPQGYHIGDGFLKLTIQDMVTIGQIMLNGGKWEGQQVVPSAWVEEATSTHVDDTATSDSPAAPGYGYLWWITTADGHPAFAAAGYGGQLIEVVPDLNLVVVVSTYVPPPPTPPRADAAGLISMVDSVIAPALTQ
jgi:CubicO group peptidase (beta-lactamase class C family)